MLTHLNYPAERVNGVAVSFDPVSDLVSGDPGAFYVNAQLGEDLVANPLALSTPEELLLRADGKHRLLAGLNQLPHGEGLLNAEQLDQLRAHLEVIHEAFADLYQPGLGEPFAIEIEFKITWDNQLAIKQARPWVFPGEPTANAAD